MRAVVLSISDAIRSSDVTTRPAAMSIQNVTRCRSGVAHLGCWMLRRSALGTVLGMGLWMPGRALVQLGRDMPSTRWG